MSYIYSFYRHIPRFWGRLEGGQQIILLHVNTSESQGDFTINFELMKTANCQSILLLEY